MQTFRLLTDEARLEQHHSTLIELTPLPRPMRHQPQWLRCWSLMSPPQWSLCLTAATMAPLCHRCILCAGRRRTVRWKAVYPSVEVVDTVVRRLTLSPPVEPAIRWKAPDCPVEVVEGMEPRPEERELAEPCTG